ASTPPVASGPGRCGWARTRCWRSPVRATGAGTSPCATSGSRSPTGASRGLRPGTGARARSSSGATSPSAPSATRCAATCPRSPWRTWFPGPQARAPRRWTRPASWWTTSSPTGRVTACCTCGTRPPRALPPRARSAACSPAQPVVDEHHPEEGGDPVADQEQEVLVLAAGPDRGLERDAHDVADHAGARRRERPALAERELDAQREEGHRAAVDVDHVGRD